MGLERMEYDTSFNSRFFNLRKKSITASLSRQTRVYINVKD
jgi:hypothetical protein